MTKRAVIGCVVMALVLAALITVYLIVTADSGRVQEDETAATVLNDRDEDGMIKMSFEKGDVSLSFVKDANGIWQFADDRTVAIYNAYVNNMASAVTSIVPNQEIVGGDEADYGFASPSLTVKCEYKDGTSFSAVFGDVNEAVGGVYLKDLSTGKIYLADSSITSAFSETRDSLTVTDETEE